MRRYVAALDDRLGARAVVHQLTPRVPADGPVAALVYRDVPSAGHVTGFTYGLSDGGRELTTTVRTTDARWAVVPARIVAALRGMCPFEPGQVLGHVLDPARQEAARREDR